MPTFEGYCVKCRSKVNAEGEQVTLKSGKKAMKGKCPKCGTTLFRFIK